MANIAHGLMLADEVPFDASAVTKRKQHDRSIPFEAYQYYAAIQRREEEDPGYGEANPMAAIEGINPEINGNTSGSDSKESVMAASDEKNEVKASEKAAGQQPVPAHANENQNLDDEWARAARATRTATWFGVFFLITTDILGPGAAP